MRTYILQENVLSDNLLLLPEEGKVFKGGYCAILKEYVFASAWCDREEVKRFRSQERLQRYLEKVYPNVEIDF